MLRRSVAAVGLIGVAGCSLFLDTSGFNDPETPTDGGPDGGPAESGGPDGGDGAGDADGGADAVTFPPQFVDDFQRPDNQMLGNGWIEKTPNAFDLAGGRALYFNSGASYKNAIVLRPASEDALNVEVSMDFTLSGAGFVGYPTIAARVSSSGPAAFDGYIFYLPATRDAVAFSRETGTSFAAVGPSHTTSETLVDGVLYHMRFRVTGISPPALQGEITKNGTSIVIWDVVDDSATPITTPGSVGFSMELGGIAIDAFSRAVLP